MEQKFTALFPGVENLLHKDRLGCLGLYCLAFRRIKDILIETQNYFGTVLREDVSLSRIFWSQTRNKGRPFGIEMRFSYAEVVSFSGDTRSSR